MTLTHFPHIRIPFVAPTIAACILSVCIGKIQASPIGYQFDGDAFYQYGDPADLSPLSLYRGAFDTSFFRITNNGASTFTGNIGQVAIGANGADRSFSVPVTLNPGQSITLGTSEESSNFGGWNGPGNDLANPQPGIKILVNGTVSLGADAELVDLSIYDRDIHSSVFKTNPFGVELDNYILQGGDPYGRDTGDDFETGQAPGHFQFYEAGVPEPTSLALVSIGIMGLASFRRGRD